MATSKSDLEDELLQTAFETVDSFRGAKCEIQLSDDIIVDCPHDDITDEYSLTITYTPRGTPPNCIEIESLSEFLTEFQDIEASQEAVCQFLAHFLFTHISPEYIEVELEGEHYGIHTTTTRFRER